MQELHPRRWFLISCCLYKMSKKEKDFMIPGYDEWKTTPPEEPEPETYCSICGSPLYEGDALYTVDGGICETCLEDYKKIL